MRKNVFGRKFKRDVNERKALFKGLASSLVLSERITTTEEKAKAVKPYIEKLVTKAKRGGPEAEMLLQPFLTKDAMQKMLIDIAPRFADRPGGYTRIVKVGNRLKDNARMAFIEWVERGQISEVGGRKSEVGGQKSDKKKTEKVSADEAVAEAVYGDKETKRLSDRDLKGKKGTKKAKKTVKKEAK